MKPRLLLFALSAALGAIAADDSNLRESATQALRGGVEFFRTEVAVQGVTSHASLLGCIWR